jgi:hypothetical protein
LALQVRQGHGLVGFGQNRRVPLLRCAPLDEGAQAGDSFADDERIHLARPFVGVDRFGIRDKAANMIVKENAVTAEQLAGIADGLAAFDRAERFRQRGVLVGREALGLQLP